MRLIERIIMSSRRFWIVLVLLWCYSMAGCGRRGPLVISKNQPHFAPWCGPNRRVQIGQRVVGHVHDGPKYKNFLIDETGKEHDPEEIAERAWSYLKRTGDAKTIEESLGQGAFQS